MSAFGADPPTSQTIEFDFWNFVTCNICHLPFVTSNHGPPSIPFWITECGHVICNNHLNPDQSCSQCGDRNIQLMALQRDMDPPMSDWFRSLPFAMDSLSTAVKFQQEALASLVRKYKTRAAQFSSTCDRLRSERKALRRDNEMLRHENAQLRQYGGYNQTGEPSAAVNSNGKRPMNEAHRQSASIKTSSSPRSIVTPVAPSRLTLPLGEHPNFTRQDRDQPPAAPTNQQPAEARPGSSRFKQFVHSLSLVIVIKLKCQISENSLTLAMNLLEFKPLNFRTSRRVQ
ncbi:hypothetical protein BJ138DRAFT_1084052 [Hygrophoropsis aurantiaca]|uniref:Uncharacterized protein n=1 Tax=Hygrophoropsis aurantiaca TaxID=72124 RepID=A0ACB8AG77_9AGAM|nr:hypothetical protein BJ138DRAFT_1084052 [Hygrophoropsis aurantiaca]